MAQKIRDEIKERGGGADGTSVDSVSSRGKAEKQDPMSSIEKVVQQIKDLVAKIEPKLPVAALV
jgi:hypothetical protein